MNNSSLSIIMPALNEENNIELAMTNALSAIDDFGIDGELICIDDASTDQTLNIMQKVQSEDCRVRIFSNDASHGFGGSFWKGVSESKMGVVVVMPGDNENDPWEILRYFNLLEQVDIAIPFVYNKEARSMYRRILSYVYRTIINFTFITNLNYTNGTILYRTAILTELEYRSSSFFFQTDIIIRLIKKGYLHAEVPYRIEQRNDGISTAVSFPSLIQVIKGYIKLVIDQYMYKDTSSHQSQSITAERYLKKNIKYKE